MTKGRYSKKFLSFSEGGCFCQVPYCSDRILPEKICIQHNLAELKGNFTINVCRSDSGREIVIRWAPPTPHGVYVSHRVIQGHTDLDRAIILLGPGHAQKDRITNKRHDDKRSNNHECQEILRRVYRVKQYGQLEIKNIVDTCPPRVYLDSQKILKK